MKSRYGYYRLGADNFPLKLADPLENAERIIKEIEKAKKASLTCLVFPELSLSGYTCNDLFLYPQLQGACLIGLKKIVNAVDTNMLVAVGLPLKVDSKLFNVAVVIFNQQILGVVPKTYVPNYNEFYEARYFSSGEEKSSEEIEICGFKVHFGADQIFDLGELKVGIEICEDLWVINPVSDRLALNGANCILNLSASNEVVSKREYRRNLINAQASKLYAAYIYASSGEGESSQDMVFSDAKLISSGGHLLNESYEPGLIYSEVDIAKLEADRLTFKTSFISKVNPVHITKVNCDDELNVLPHKVDSHPFVPENEVKREERAQEIFDLQVKSLVTRLTNCNFKKVVLGVSGGLDSTLALLVVYEAFKKLNLDMKYAHFISMPGFGTSKQTFDNAKKLIELTGAKYSEIDITKACKQHLQDISHPEDKLDVTYENTQARMRTMILMDVANQEGGIVIGTGDLSELALGFCTYNGDHMSMYGVNASIPKTLVKSLVHHYALTHKDFYQVLEDILSTPISPELLPTKKGSIQQKTEGILGRYDFHDFFLYHFKRNHFSKEKIRALALIAFKEVEESEIDKALDIFFNRFFSQQFKRDALPDGAKIGSVSLSPRGDFRMPSDIPYLNVFQKEEK